MPYDDDEAAAIAKIIVDTFVDVFGRRPCDEDEVAAFWRLPAPGDNGRRQSVERRSPGSTTADTRATPASGSSVIDAEDHGAALKRRQRGCGWQSEIEKQERN